MTDQDLVQLREAMPFDCAFRLSNGVSMPGFIYGDSLSRPRFAFLNLGDRHEISWSVAHQVLSGAMVELSALHARAVNPFQ